MLLTSTDANNSLGPVPAKAPLSPAALTFYEQYKDWVDEQNRHVEQHGIWNEEFRPW
jgi:hypothetical protein